MHSNPMKSIRTARIAAGIAALPFLVTALRAQQAGSEVPTADAADGFSVSLVAGYDTHYVFRGEEILDNSVWSQLEVSIPLTDNVAFGLVPFFLSSPENAYSEVDLNPSLTVSTDLAEITAGYALYNYPRGLDGGGEGIPHEQEVSLSLSREIGPVEIALLTAWNFDREGLYSEIAVSSSLKLTDRISLEPAVSLGHSSNYYAADGLSHVGIVMALPVSLTESATLTPHVSAVLPLEALEEGQDNLLYGGISLNVSF